MKLSRGLRSYPGIGTTSAAGLLTAVAREGVVVRPALAKVRDPCRLRRRHRSSRAVTAQHLQVALLNSRTLSWQKPTSRDKLYDLTSYVRKLKINVACISEMKNFNPEGERVSFVFIEEYIFILAESTGILLDPMCRIAFQNKGSIVQTGNARSLLIKLRRGSSIFSDGGGRSDEGSGIGECTITHLSGKIVENTDVSGRRLEWSHWERSWWR